MKKIIDKQVPLFLIGVLLFLIAAIPGKIYAQQPKLMLPVGHVGGAELTFSADSKKVLTNGDDGTAKIWDIQSGLMLADLVGHKGKIASAQFFSNGQKILTTSEDNSIRVWSTSSGELLQTLGYGRGTYQGASLSTSEKQLIIYHNLGGITNTTVWDIGTGKLLCEVNESQLKGDDGKIFGVTPEIDLSPDGKTYVRSDIYHLRPDSSIVVIADTRSGKRMDTLAGIFNDILSVQYTPDGKYVIALGQDFFDDSTGKGAAKKVSWVMLTWNAVTGKLLHTGKLENWNKLYVTKGGRINNKRLWFDPAFKDLLFLDCSSSVETWNILTGKKASSIPVPVSAKSSYILGKNKRTLFVNDGKLLKVLDIVSYKPIDSFEHSAEVVSFRINNKNNVAVTLTKDNRIYIWDIASRKLLRSLETEEEKILLIEPGPFDNHLVLFTKHDTGDDDDEKISTNVKMWDWGTNKFLWTQELPGKKPGAAFSQDGKSLAIHFNYASEYVDTKINQDDVTIVDAGTGKKKSNFTGHASYVRSAAFSPDKKKIVTSYTDSTIKIWNIEKGKFTNTLTGHHAEVNMVQFSADGSYLASASDDSTVKLWDAVTGKLIYTLEGSEGPVHSARFSTDMKYIITTSDDDGRIWDLGSGKLLRVLEGAGGYDARFSQDGKYIISDTRVFTAATGKILFELDWHNGRINYSQFSSDGKYIVTASADETAKLWSLDYGELLYSFDDHTDEVVFAAFSKDNKKVITASLDNTVKVWDVQTGRLERTIDLGPNTVVKDIHIEGNKLLCVSAGSETSIVDFSTGKLLYSFLALEKNGYLVVDRFDRFDGTENARKLLYFTCDDEVIELDQVKDQLWTPGLAERIIKGDTINATKLADLNICGLTPQVKQTDTTKGAYHFLITPRRGGLGETALYLNGIEIKRYSKSQLKYNAGAYELVVNKSELSAYLISGQENTVNVKAWIGDNTISSRGIIVQVNNKKDTIASPALYAVFVGISDYKGDELDLKYAAKDAGDIAAALSLSARKLLNTDGKEHVFIYDLTTAEGRYRLPEKSGIRKTLEEIGTKASANDILLLFFAGHGIMQGTDKKQFYFLTADASRAAVNAPIGEMGISIAELTDWVKPASIKAQKRVLIFDACNSGQAIRDFVQLGKPGQGYVAARSDESGQQIKAIEKLNSQSGMIILSASASDQNAYEMGRYSQGLLTYSLLKVMKQQPEILENGKYLDVTNWLNASKKMVVQLAEGGGKRQEPQLNTNNNFNIGIIDEEIRSGIVLSSEKPLFTRSNFQNLQTRIDDLKFRQATDKELISLSNSTNADISYSADYDGADGYTLSGDYKITGDQVLITGLLVKGGVDIKHRFELSGAVTDLAALAGAMTQTALTWLKSNR